MARLLGFARETLVRLSGYTPRQFVYFAIAANLVMSAITLTLLRDFRHAWFDSELLPRARAGALETTAGERGFDFYFDLKSRYPGAAIVAADGLIDADLLDRLTFIKASQEPYQPALSGAEEAELSKLPAWSTRYFPRVRHPASKNVGQQATAFFLQPREPVSKVYLMRGARGLYVVPSSALPRLNATRGTAS